MSDIELFIELIVLCFFVVSCLIMFDPTWAILFTLVNKFKKRVIHKRI